MTDEQRAVEAEMSAFCQLIGGLDPDTVTGEQAIEVRVAADHLVGEMERLSYDR